MYEPALIITAAIMIAVIDWYLSFNIFIFGAVAALFSDFVSLISIITLISRIVNSTSDLLLSLIKFLTILAVSILLYLIAHKISQKEKGIVVIPFETFSDGKKEMYDGKAISDLLTYELHRISHIHNQKIPDLYISINTIKYGFRAPHIFEDFLKERLLPAMMPQSETLEYSVSEIGTVKTGVLELSLGQLLTAFKRLLPEEYRHDTITGSLQEYGPYTNIVAYMEGKGIHAWKISRKISEKENPGRDHIQFMVENLAYKISHQLAKGDDESKSERAEGPMVSAESWLAWKYYTEALEAYQEFVRSKRIYDRNKARKNCLMALKIEKGYERPLRLLSVLGFFYIDNEKDRDIARDIFNLIRESKTELVTSAASGLGILNLTIRNYRDSINYFIEAIKSDPLDPMVWFGKGMAHEELWNETILSKKYIFCWEDIPGKEDVKLINFLYEIFEVDWAKDAKIEKIDNGKAIQVSNEKNTLFLVNVSRNEVYLVIDDGRIDKFKIATEKNRLYICPKIIVAESSGGYGSEGSELNKTPLYGCGFSGLSNSGHASYYQDPADPPLYDPILFADSQDQELKDALEAFDKTTKIDPNHSEGWYHKGLIHCRRDELEEAENAFVNALKIDPNNAEIWYHKGVILCRRDDYEDAIKSFDEVIKIDPPHFAEEGSKQWPSYPYIALSWFYKGLSLSKLGRYDEADQAYSKALETDSENALFWYYIGFNRLNLYYLRRYSEALDAFNHAIDKKYDYPSAWFMKAFCHLTLGTPELALKAASKALYMDFQNSALLDMKGIAVAQLGKYSDAWVWYNQAIDRDRQNAFTRNRIYLIFKALGLDKEAEEASAKADELGYVAPPPLIKVEFTKESILSDQGSIVINSRRQLSENNLSHELESSDDEIHTDYHTPIKLGDSYELIFKSIDADHKRERLELMKDGHVCDSMELGDEVHSTYEFPDKEDRRRNDMRGLRKSASKISEQAFYDRRYIDIFEIGFSSKSR